MYEYINILIKGHYKTINEAINHLANEEIFCRQMISDDFNHKDPLDFIESYLFSSHRDLPSFIKMFPSLKVCAFRIDNYEGTCDAIYSESGSEDFIAFPVLKDSYVSESSFPCRHMLAFGFLKPLNCFTKYGRRIVFTYKPEFTDEWVSGIFVDKNYDKEMEKLAPEDLELYKKYIKFHEVSIRGLEEECWEIKRILSDNSYIFTAKVNKKGVETIDIHIKQKRIDKMLFIDLIKRFPNLKVVFYGKTNYTDYDLLYSKAGSSDIEAYGPLVNFVPSGKARPYTDKAYIDQCCVFPFKKDWEN